jgi:hypothetical protein
MKTEKSGPAQGSGRALACSTRREQAGHPTSHTDTWSSVRAACMTWGLDENIAAFAPEREHQKEIRALFARLPRDPQVIAYRQAVLEDLLANPELAGRLAALLPVIDSFFEYSYRSEQEMSWLHEVVWRAGSSRI